MLVVDKSQVILEDGNLVAEASTLGLAPGNWPDFISVVDDSGSGYLFRRQTKKIMNGDDFGGYCYVASKGETLIVFND